KASGAPEFSPQVIAEVHRCAQGRPGRVNALCQQLVHNAALDEAARSLTPGSVLAMAGELGYGVPPIDAPVEPVEPVVSAPAPAAQPAQARRRWGLIATVVAAIVAIGGTALFAALQFAPGGRKAEATIATQPSASVVPAASAPAPVAAQSVQASSEPAKPSALAEASASPPPSPLLRAESQSGAGAEPSPPLPASSPALSLVEGPPAALASAGAAPATVSPKPVRRSPNASPAPAAQSISRAAAADCARLLSQLSLGEPLTATQQHTFRSICR
ncbi:MAG: hypothetical protein JWQ88_1829, partial [Rhodoferax sp.]|nr:hypothetical protein [Rhodoferax sp.]